MKRKNFSKSFKAKVAIEAIKGQRLVNEIAREFSVHPSQINRWKQVRLTDGKRICWNQRLTCFPGIKIKKQSSLK